MIRSVNQKAGGIALQITDHINRYQLLVLCLSMASGAKYLALPREIVQAAGRDAWLSIILGGTLIICCSVAISYLSSLFPALPITSYSQKILGNTAGKAFNLMLLATILMHIIFQVLSFSHIVVLFILPKTPLWAVAFILLAVALYVSFRGLLPLARVIEIMIPPLIIMYFFITFLSLQQGEPRELLPLLDEGIVPVVKGALPSLAFSGPELIIGFLYCRVQPAKKLAQTIALAGTVVLLRITLLVITCIMVLSPNETINLLYPGVTVYKVISLPALVVTERVEFILMILVIPLTILNLSIALFFAQESIRQTFPIKHPLLLSFALAAACWSPILFPLDVLEMAKLTKIYHQYTAFFSLGILPSLLVITLIQRKMSRSSQQCQDR